MSYEDLISGLKLNQQLFDNKQEEPKELPKNKIESNNDVPLFNINGFKDDLREKSAIENKRFAETNERLNAYDIVHNCIRTPLFRLLGAPVEDYSTNWLPLRMRSTIGSACHDFLQDNSSSFTETEVYLRIPSLQMSVKIDCLTGTNTLVEIKTCNYTDYAKILKTNTARQDDLNQAILYKYLLENYTAETKSQDIDLVKYNLPKHDHYNITTIQMIYLCHELFMADGTLDESVRFAKELKQQLKTKFNYMWFLKPINYDLTKINFTPYIDKVKDKLNETVVYFKEKKIPTMDHRYVDSKKCFFCLYKKHCKHIS